VSTIRIRPDLPRFGLLCSHLCSVSDTSLPRKDRQLRYCSAPDFPRPFAVARGGRSFPPEDRPPLLGLMAATPDRIHGGSGLLGPIVEHKLDAARNMAFRRRTAPGRDLVLERLPRHGPASEGDRRHGRNRDPYGALAPAAPAKFPAPITRWSSWSGSSPICTARRRRWSSPRATCPTRPASRPSPNCCRIA
jgi:hypothetical protein